MVDVTINDGVVTFDVQGLDKLWSLKSRLDISLAHLKGVRADPSVAHGWWHGIRLPGTNIPGVLTAGTFYHDGKRVFWDVHNPENTVVIELLDERYNELIVEVADPATVVSRLHAAIAARTSR
jgi:hypothetical protein